MTGAAEHHLHAELWNLSLGCLAENGVQPEDQHWPWWPMLPHSD